MTGSKSVLIAVVALLFLASSPPPVRIDSTADGHIAIAYGETENPEHVPIKKILEEHRILEQFRDLLSMFKLPRQLKLAFDDCEGDPDAWYEPALHKVTICYDYIGELRKKAPRETTEEGVTPEDAVVGPVMEVVLHEVAHAIFHILELPILGREEDAADQFAAIMLLQMGEDTARRTIAATAHMYWRENEESPPDHSDFASSHSPPIQRFYQLVCIAYGWDEKLFSFVRETYLEPQRADECGDEVATLKASFAKLIGPHIDPAAHARLDIANWMPAAKRMLKAGQEP